MALLRKALDPTRTGPALSLLKPAKLYGALPVFTAALAAVTAGTRNANILFIGDDSISGTGSNGTASSNSTVQSSLPARLAAAIGAGFDSMIGSHFYGLAFNSSVDTRVATTSWTTTSTYYLGLGGSPFSTATAGSLLSFSPAKAFDTIEIYYAAQGSGLAAGMTVNVDGGATLLTINDNSSSNTYKKITTTCTLGNHVVNIVSGSSGTHVVYGVHCYNSALKTVEITNAGLQGGSSTTLNSTTYPWSTLNAISVHTPDLIVIDCNNYSIGTGITAATYQSDLTAIVTAAQAAGADVLLSTGIPVDPTSSNASYQTAYYTAVFAVAAARGAAVLDYYSYWGTYAARYASGWYYSNRYPNATGTEQKMLQLQALLPSLGPVAYYAPQLTATPTISYTSLNVGSLITGTTGSFNANPTATITYQWYRGSTAIAGATTLSYTLAVADAGSTIKLVAVATNNQGSISATSNAATALALSAPVNSVAPILTATSFNVGGVASVTPGTWTSNPTATYSYQWLSNNVQISGATSSSYTIQASDAGFTLSVAVTAVNSQGSVSITAINNTVITTSPVAPTGYKYLTDSDGAILTDTDGARLIEAA